MTRSFSHCPKWVLISVKLYPSSHHPLPGEERVQNTPCHVFYLADISVGGKAECSSINFLLRLLDAPQPARFPPKLSHQAEPFFYLGAPLTDILATALRHQQKPLAHPGRCRPGRPHVPLGALSGELRRSHSVLIPQGMQRTQVSVGWSPSPELPVGGFWLVAEA